MDRQQIVRATNVQPAIEELKEEDEVFYNDVTSQFNYESAPYEDDSHTAFTGLSFDETYYDAPENYNEAQQQAKADNETFEDEATIGTQGDATGMEHFANPLGKDDEEVPADDVDQTDPPYRSD